MEYTIEVETVQNSLNMDVVIYLVRGDDITFAETRYIDIAHMIVDALQTKDKA